MPLLAAFIGNLAAGLVAVLGRFMSLRLAMKLASYTAWITVFTAFVASVFICTSGLVAGFSAMFASASGGWSLGSAESAIISGFGMGLGMFIPANAATVVSCMASVWIACQIYKIQRDGMHNYSK
jgi:hypothetical protein